MQANIVKCGFCEGGIEKYAVEKKPFIKVICDTCGCYYISEELNRRIQSSLPIELDQGRVNCARENLRISFEEKPYEPLWIVGHRPPDGKEPRIFYHGDLDKTFVRCVYDEISREPVDHAEKPVDFLLAMANRMASTNAFADLPVQRREMVLSRIAGENELTKILGYLEESKAIQWGRLPNFKQGPFDTQVAITVLGWERIREKRQFSNSRDAFIAMQFEWPGNKNLRQQVEGAIKGACAACGYEGHLVSDEPHSDWITNKIIADIKKARFIVADFTFNNRGVYFEAGYARALGRPVIHTVMKGHDSRERKEDSAGKMIHFDIQQINYLIWDDPQKLEEQLAAWIEAMVGKFRTM